MRDLEQARAARQRAEHDAQHAPRWRDRRSATKELILWAERETDAQKRYQLHVTPEIVRLDHTIDACQLTLERVQARSEQYRQAERVVAEVASFSSHNAHRLQAHLAIYRNDIDGLPQPPILRPAELLHAQEMRPHPPAVQPSTPRPPQLGIGM